MSDTIEQHGVTEDPKEVQVAASSVEVPSYQARQSFGQMLRGDLGFIPVLITLLIIIILFEVLTNGLFLQPQNFTNLILQSSSLGIYSAGVVLVLLLGEIDLSAASVGVLGAIVMAVLTERQGWGAGPAIILGILTGVVFGLINGIFVAILRIPSFIVTLATFIIASGLTLVVLQGQTTQGVANPFVVGIAGTPTSYFTNFWGIGLPTVAILLYIGSLFYGYFSRKKAGLRTMSMARLIIQSALSFIVVEGAVALLESYLGVPYSIGIFFAIVIIIWLALTKTSWGRHVYATGGNTEAARRAGINVVGMRIAIFTLCSTVAVLAAVVETSREAAVSSNIGPMLQLNIIAAAVIGGVSLFGGRGSVWSVVLGMLIVQALANGLALLNQPAEVQQIAEGVVLLLAVTADALIRQAQARSRSGR